MVCARADAVRHAAVKAAARRRVVKVIIYSWVGFVVLGMQAGHVAALKKGNDKETKWEGARTRAFVTLVLPRLNAALLMRAGITRTAAITQGLTPYATAIARV